MKKHRLPEIQEQFCIFVNDKKFSHDSNRSYGKDIFTSFYEASELLRYEIRPINKQGKYGKLVKDIKIDIYFAGSRIRLEDVKDTFITLLTSGALSNNRLDHISTTYNIRIAKNNANGKYPFYAFYDVTKGDSSKVKTWEDSNIMFKQTLKQKFKEQGIKAKIHAGTRTILFKSEEDVNLARLTINEMQYRGWLFDNIDKIVKDFKRLHKFLEPRINVHYYYDFA